MPAFAQQILVLAEDVPAGLDYDGPAGRDPDQPDGHGQRDGAARRATRPTRPTRAASFCPTFSTFEGRLVESWSYDPATLTWTLKLRQGVQGCGGATFNADDVLYTFARGKSVSGAAPIGWFLSNVGLHRDFTPDVFGEEPKRALGDEVTKVDDYTVTIRQSEPNALFLPVLTIFGL